MLRATLMQSVLQLGSEGLWHLPAPGLGCARATSLLQNDWTGRPALGWWTVLGAHGM